MNSSVDRFNALANFCPFHRVGAFKPFNTRQQAVQHRPVRTDNPRNVAFSGASIESNALRQLPVPRRTGQRFKRGLGEAKCGLSSRFME